MFTKLWQTKASHSIGVYFRPDMIAVVVMNKSGLQQLHTKPITSSELWPQALAEIVSKNQLKKGRVYGVLSQHFYQQLQIERPNVADDELTQSLPFAIKELVSEPLHELVLDYYQVPAVPMMAERLNVIYSQKSVIKRVVKSVAEAGLTLEHIGIEELALANLLTAQAETQMLIYQHSADDVRISVVRDNALYFSRHLRGFQSLCQQAQQMDTFLLEGLGLELQRSLDYVVAQLKIADVNRIKLSLPSPYANEIAEQIGETLGRKVIAIPMPDTPEQGDALPAMAAIPFIGQINLVADEVAE
ncbi:biogenesis protein MshI [Motilimonas cestriensis]|uniref:Biogenesis protein MshI n=1 Tax=Motilimonas cestriensis TaxID=2742685 RepID=A0ABS8WEN9_9GAMM|nr:biogenesis protein MshI [Motilimonas cestriensis]MCE2596029.1 biogenesis protein MshI [Motilimonas cestriensis]